MLFNIYFDGGTALNVICVFDASKQKSIVDYMVTGLTNNQLEYRALLRAVQYVREVYGSIRDIVFCGDSEVIIKHMKGDYQVRKPHLKILKKEVDKEFMKMGETSNGYNFQWVPRENNKAGNIIEELNIKSKSSIYE